MPDINENTRVAPGAVERKQIRTNIIDFRNKIGELARPNIFEVEINFPTLIEGSSGGGINNQEDAQAAAAGRPQESNVKATELSSFLVKAANLPASTIGVIEVPFRGRTLKIAGDRTFEPWTVTVLNDEGFRLRRKFEAWSKAIQSLPVNLSDASSIASYQSRAIVRQQNRQGLHTAAYTFEGIWPSNISAIDLAWDSNDTPEEYTVEFQVQYWQHANDTNTANAQ
jgi:hypothetical protein